MFLFRCVQLENVFKIMQTISMMLYKFIDVTFRQLLFLITEGDDDVLLKNCKKLYFGMQVMVQRIFIKTVMFIFIINNKMTSF